MGEQTAGTATPRQTGDPVPSRPRDTIQGQRERAGGVEGPCAKSGAQAQAESGATGQEVGLTARSRPRTELRRVTVCEHDERLEVKSVRGIGFSWRCTCGEHGRVWHGRGAAVAEKREHERGHL